jgi:23S rRNA (uracil1939-C5)-methyltransferase
MSELIVRIAARGDGVTTNGRHVPFGVPGDALLDDGALAFGPHHQEPPCRHFPECGGCQLQHADDEAYLAYLVSRIQTALAHHGLETDIRVPRLSPSHSRRRATLRAMKVGAGILLGFNAERSHRIVDMRECHILRPELFDLTGPLRELLAGMMQPKRPVDVQLTLVDQGPDVLIKGITAEGLAELESLTSFAAAQKLARLSVEQGMGSETLYEPEPATATLSGLPVAFPPGGFLQATKDGETALVDAIKEALADAPAIADLFAGLGTFSLGTGARYAAEASSAATRALKAAMSKITVEHRDLYRRPLDAEELKRFDAVVLDPPRAGAEQQVTALAKSSVGQIAYVSCNPATFARDARILVDGGYALKWIAPVGQFRWSTHVELAACLSR